jgi:hypothetical protein
MPTLAEKRCEIRPQALRPHRPFEWAFDKHVKLPCLHFSPTGQPVGVWRLDNLAWPNPDTRDR